MRLGQEIRDQVVHGRSGIGSVRHGAATATKKR
jgi:hypothetical protein